MRLTFGCAYEDAATWILIAVIAGLVLGMGGLAFALVGSRFARWLGFGAIAIAALVVVLGAVAPRLPMGSASSPEVHAWYLEEQRRQEASLTPEQRATTKRLERDLEAADRRACLGFALGWAALPLLVGAMAVGVALIRKRSA
jgi:hypothetical protein